MTTLNIRFLPKSLPFEVLKIIFLQGKTLLCIVYLETIQNDGLISTNKKSQILYSATLPVVYMYVAHITTLTNTTMCNTMSLHEVTCAC